MAAGNLAKLSTAVVDLAKTALALKLAAAPVDAKTGLVTPRLDEKSSVGKLVDKLRSTLDTLKAVIGRAPKAVVQELEAIKFTGSGLFWDDAYARSTIASLRAEEQATEKLQGLISLCTTAAVDTMPEECVQPTCPLATPATLATPFTPSTALPPPAVARRRPTLTAEPSLSSSYSAGTRSSAAFAGSSARCSWRCLARRRWCACTRGR